MDQAPDDGLAEFSVSPDDLSTNGSMVYSTFFGGESLDSSRGIAVNSSGEAIITGNTSSDNFPTQNPIHGFSGNTDVFVTKFNSQGSALVYSTYLGGDADEFGRGIAVDAAGNAHVVGLTNSQNFPIVPGALRNRSTLFKSIDGGTKWSNDNYGLSLGFNSAITSLIVHPTQTSTIYAGTLKGVYNSFNLRTQHLIVAEQRTVNSSAQHDQVRFDLRSELYDLLVRPAFNDV